MKMSPLPKHPLVLFGPITSHTQGALGTSYPYHKILLEIQGDV